MMNEEIFELSNEEIQTVSGGNIIDPQSTLTVDYPEIDNNPPVPP